MTQKALLVGINYPNTSHSLRGCVNDVINVKRMLTSRYDFDIVMLTDEEATTENILRELEALVFDAKPGDVLYFHYSGHGSQMVDDYDDDYEPDGLDEIICPVDLDWYKKVIRDDDLKRIFDKVPNGVNLTVTLDCCHSGGGMDQTEQYQSLGEAKVLNQPGGRFLAPPANIITEAKERAIGFKPKSLTRNVEETGVLVSGCQSHQTSADAYIDDEFVGACTYAFLKVINDMNGNVTHKELVDKMNNFMVTHGYTQRPELNGAATLHDAKLFYTELEEVDLVTPTFEPMFEPVDPVIEPSIVPVDPVFPTILPETNEQVHEDDEEAFDGIMTHTTVIVLVGILLAICAVFFI